MALDFQERFWSKVAQADSSSCWPWSAATDKDGYGVFGVSTRIKSARAHRIAWLLTRGDPKRQLVLHTCDNPSCCNPDHLFLGTPADNMKDKVRKGRHVSGMRTKPERAAKGSAHGSAKLTEEQVKEIRKRYIPRKVTLHQLGAEYNVSFTTVHNALKYGWRHVDGP